MNVVIKVANTQPEPIPRIKIAAYVVVYGVVVDAAAASASVAVEVCDDADAIDDACSTIAATSAFAVCL